MNLTTSQAASLRRVNPSTIRRWCESGKIQAVKIGRDWMIDGDSLIAKHQHPARKGKVNRVSLACRVEPKTLEAIWRVCRERGLSQGEVIDTWRNAALMLPDLWSLLRIGATACDNDPESQQLIWDAMGKIRKWQDMWAKKETK